jgi:2,3-bisphosphoglycerate-dependent phosphoglycerate mutase
MSLLAMIRHGATDWNAKRRLQGRADRPLSAQGKAQVRRWHVPALLQDACWSASPLARAKETAALLSHPDPIIEPALIEMDWGDWEGRTREELIAELSSELVDRNPLGREFRSPRGESPREVWARLSPWIAAIAKLGKPTVAVTHRGVMRAVYAEATGWDMVGRPADELTANAAHLFLARIDGSVALIRANLMLS